MLWRQKRTQLPILKIDFAMENKTQKQQTKHLETEVSFSNLDLNTAREKPPSLSVFVEIFVWCTRLLRRAEPYSQLPFLLYYLRAIYNNSWKSLLKAGIHRYHTLFQEYFNADRYKITRDLQESTESFLQFSTSLSANSLPVHKKLLRQNKSTLVPEETEF